MIVGMADEIPEEYARAIDQATTRKDLLSVVMRYGEVAADAVDLVQRMHDEDFEDWRHALKKERKGRFMGEEAFARFGAIILPEVMFKVATVASDYQVPWGLAYHRLKDVGRLTIKDDVASVDF